jgi:cyclin-dependent kinase-like
LGSEKYGTEVDTWAIGCIMGELTDGQPLFPGESDVDQLHIVCKSMGAMTGKQRETAVERWTNQRRSVPEGE